MVVDLSERRSLAARRGPETHVRPSVLTSRAHAEPLLPLAASLHRACGWDGADHADVLDKGRFVQRDPITANVPRAHYQYAGSNPLTFVDPTGMDEEEWKEFLAEAEKYNLPTTYFRQVAGSTDIDWEDPPEGARAHYDGSDIDLPLDEFRDPMFGNLKLKQFRELVKDPDRVAAIFHEMFHAWYDKKLEKDDATHKKVLAAAKAAFTEVTDQDYLNEAADEAMGNYIHQFVNQMATWAKNDIDAKERSQIRLRDWTREDREKTDAIYTRFRTPGSGAYGYYQAGGKIVHLTTPLPKFFVDFVHHDVFLDKYPATYGVLLQQSPFKD